MPPVAAAQPARPPAPHVHSRARPHPADGFQLEGCDTFADDDPKSVAALVQQCLTQQDRQLLARLEKTALAQQLLGQQAVPQPAAGAAPAADAAAGRAAGGAALGHAAAAKAQQLHQRVDQLLSRRQTGQGRQQPDPSHAAGAGLASSLFGTAGLFGSSKGGGAAATAGAAGGGDGPTVSELMGLFKASPLFRGGPVPGVQVLHQR